MLTEVEASQDFDNVQVTYNNQQGSFTGKQTILTETDQRLSYFMINTPLMILPAEGFRVMVGPSFGFLMGGKRNTDATTTVKGTFNNNQIDDTSFETEKKKGSAATKNFRSLEICAMAGVGYTLDFGLDMDLRFYRGIVTNYDESSNDFRYRIWTNMIEFSFGWTFNTGGGGSGLSNMQGQ